MSKPSLVSFDVETTGLSAFHERLYSLAIAWTGADGQVCSAVYPSIAIPQKVKDLLADPEVAKVGANARFDRRFLARNGMPVLGRVHCTRLMQHLINEEESGGLKELTLKHFGPKALTDKARLDQLLKEHRFTHVGQLCAYSLANAWKHFDVISEYNREDAVNTLRLFDVLKQRLITVDANVKRAFGCAKGPKDYYFEESLQAEEPLLDMEMSGISLRREELDAYGEELDKKAGEIQREMEALVQPEIDAIRDATWEEERAERKTAKGRAGVPRPDFNWGSSDHLGTLLYQSLQLPARRTPKGKWCTQEDILATLREQAPPGSRASKLLGLFASWKSLQKERNTYVGDEERGLLSHVVKSAEGLRIHGEYGQFTDTGRTSSSNPNMQNLPRGSRCKRAFVPKPGHAFIYLDYSQVELRIAAHLSQDPVMVQAFRDGEDLHRMTAASAFGKDESDVTDDERQGGKKTNFAMIFDASPKRLSEELGKSEEECKHFKEAFFLRFPRYKEHLKEILDVVREKRAIVSESGRVRRLPDISYGEGLDWRRRTWRGTPAQEQVLRASKAFKEALKKYGGDEQKSLQEAASKRYSHAKKQAYNFPIQSLGATITKRAMIALRKAGYRLVNTVHDSIVVEVPASQVDTAKPDITRIAESAYPLSVPLKVDVKVLSSLHEGDKWVAVSAAA